MAGRNETSNGTTANDAWGDLMRAGLAGDGAAYRRLLEALTPRLRAVATRSFAGTGAGDVEDVVQEPCSPST